VHVEYYFGALPFGISAGKHEEIRKVVRVYNRVPLPIRERKNLEKRPDKERDIFESIAK
jgi:hypothetical protein